MSEYNFSTGVLRARLVDFVFLGPRPAVGGAPGAAGGGRRPRSEPCFFAGALLAFLTLLSKPRHSVRHAATKRFATAAAWARWCQEIVWITMRAGFTCTKNGLKWQSQKGLPKRLPKLRYCTIYHIILRVRPENQMEHRSVLPTKECSS